VPSTQDDEERQRLKEQERLYKEILRLQEKYRDYLARLLTERKKSLKKIVREVVNGEKILLQYMSEIIKVFLEYKKAAESSKIKIEEKCDELKKLLSEPFPKSIRGDYQAAIDAMWIKVGSTLQNASEHFSVHTQKALQKNQLQQEEVQIIIEALEEEVASPKQESKGEEESEQGENISTRFEDLQYDINDLLNMLVMATQEGVGSLGSVIDECVLRLYEVEPNPLFVQIIEKFKRDSADIPDEEEEKQKLERLQGALLGLLSFPKKEALLLWEQFIPDISRSYVREFSEMEEEYRAVELKYTRKFETILNTTFPEKKWKKNFNGLTKMLGKSLQHLDEANEEESSLKLVIKQGLANFPTTPTFEKGEENGENGKDLALGDEEHEEQEADLADEKTVQRFLMKLVSFPKEEARSLWQKVAPIFSKFFVANVDVATQKYFEFFSIPRILFNTIVDKMEEIQRLYDIKERFKRKLQPQLKSDETKIADLQDKIKEQEEKLERICESRRKRKKSYKDISEKIQKSIRLMSSLKMSFNEEKFLELKDLLQSLKGNFMRKHAETALGYLDKLTKCREESAQYIKKIEENEIKCQEIRDQHAKKEEKLRKKEEKLSDITLELEENESKYAESIKCLEEKIKEMKEEEEKKQKPILSARESLMDVQNASVFPDFNTPKAEDTLINLRNELSQEDMEKYIAEEKILAAIKAELKECKEKLQSTMRPVSHMRISGDEEKEE